MLRHLAHRSGNVCSLAGRWACSAALLFGIESTAARAVAQTPVAAPVAPRAVAQRATPARATPARATPARATPARATPARATPAPGEQPAASKASCAAAYESAQESRASGALQRTRSQLAYCAQTECPAFVQKDCAHWLQEVDRELPSIVVSVRGLEAGAEGVILKLDGQPVADAFSGKAISLDPGQHQLVLERQGAEPVTRTLLAQQGVQNRTVEFRVGEASVGVAASESVFDADAAAPSTSPLRSLAFVSWGVGAVGFGAFAVLGTLARADEDRFREDCAAVAPTRDLLGPGVCLQSTADRRREKYEREEVLADVGLITGIAGAVAGTALFVLSTSAGASDDAEPKAAARLELSPLPGGAWAGVTGAF